jgi:hypothetical protein
MRVEFGWLHRAWALLLGVWRGKWDPLGDRMGMQCGIIMTDPNVFIGL